MTRTLLALPAILISTWAAAQVTSPRQTDTAPLVSLSVQAEQATSNDLFRATAYAEATDTNSATLARNINQQIAAGLALAKAYTSVKAQTGNSHSYPSYSEKQRTIEHWRMRSEILLESRSATELAELLGKLQGTLQVSQLSAIPSPETRSKAEAEATVSALRLFRERAQLVASTLGKPYRIRELNISSHGRSPGSQPVYARALAAAAAPMPVEGGESQVVVTVSGKIELTE